MDVYVDATTLIALGNVGELALLTNFDGRIVIVSAVADEVSTGPAKSNIDRFQRDENVRTRPTTDLVDETVIEAKELLGDSELNGDVAIVSCVLAGRGTVDAIEQDDAPTSDHSMAVVSDDRRVRTVAESLGATVTGTLVVVVRAVHEGMDQNEAKELVRRLDSQGLHMTGELRETAYRLVGEAAKEREDR